MVREKAFPGGHRKRQVRRPRGRTGRLVCGIAGGGGGGGQLGGSVMSWEKGVFWTFELETPVRHLRGDIELTVGNKSLDSESVLRLE